MPEFTAQVRELAERTESALGALEQNDRWTEALEIYHSAGTELDALRVPRADAAHKPARKLRAYLYLREANALRALGRHAEAAPLADLELSADDVERLTRASDAFQPTRGVAAAPHIVRRRLKR